MKKIFLIFGLVFCLCQFAFAQELSTQTMPSDEEIMKIIESYHLDKSQEEQVFKETKKRLQEVMEDVSKPVEEETKKPE